MIDINTIISQALAAAVAQATAPLLERIAALEAAAQQPLEGALTDRVAALEKHTAVLDEHGGLLEYLDNQEWFWHKIRNFTDTAVEQAVDAHTACWDHNDFVTEDKLDDYVTSEALDSEVRDAVSDIMEGATVSIRI